VFNALTPVQVLAGIGQTLRMAAEAKVLEGHQRSQLLSAYSVSRLLASEQAAAAELLAWMRRALAGALEGDERPPSRHAADAIAAAGDAVVVGRIVADLLAALPAEDATRLRVHAVLREMTDREVLALDTPAR
jgi:hypothetical protein